MTSLTLVRRIAARPSIVFEALVTPEGIAAWWGPEDLPVLHAEADARVGGSYRVRFQTSDGREHEASGEYLEVAPPRRLVMSWRWTFGGGTSEQGRTSRVEFDLAPIPGGTELTFTHADLANEVSRDGHASGWTGAFDKLERILGSAGAPGDHRGLPQ